MRRLAILPILGVLLLSACGGGSSSSTGTQVPLTLAGNWQFTLAPAPDGSFQGGPQGGFLLQTGGAVTGAAAYAVYLPSLAYPCNSGSASITGTLNGQAVSLNVAAGTQTFTLTGTLSLDSSTMSGTFTSSAGTAGDGSPCGTAQTGLQWSASSVPPLTGTIQGSFHSSGGAAGLDEQAFLVSGAFTQAANTGASNASITGNLSFLNSASNLSDYPCFTSASVNGQISGNVVTLQVVGSDGSTLGQIGAPIGSNGVTGISTVNFAVAQGAYVLDGAGPSYMVATPGCPGNLSSTSTAGDFGNICLALNSTSACQQPITLTPSALTFSAQVLGTPPTTQTITLANVSGAAISGLTLQLANDSGATNFTKTDACGVNGAPSQGQPFDLVPQQSCAVMITFAPQETCAAGLPPSKCPSSLKATLTVLSPGNDTIFTAPVSGNGVNPPSAPAFAQSLFNPGNHDLQDAERHAQSY